MIESLSQPSTIYVENSIVTVDNVATTENFELAVLAELSKIVQAFGRLEKFAETFSRYFLYFD